MDREQERTNVNQKHKVVKMWRMCCRYNVGELSSELELSMDAGGRSSRSHRMQKQRLVPSDAGVEVVGAVECRSGNLHQARPIC